jgi:dipeptidyl-peptidase-4
MLLIRLTTMLGETSIIPIVNEGTVLYCRMITPPDFDKPKYPVVYVWRTHVQQVTNSWLVAIYGCN